MANVVRGSREGSTGQERRLPVAGPSITQSEVDFVTEAARSAWYTHANDPVDAFEDAFARYCGRARAVSLPSCTSAIHLSLAAAGIGPGDEVIVPDATWIATAAPISYVGATPRFADVDLETWCIDATSVDQLINARTRAVIAVDLYGGMPDYSELTSICDARGLLLIEDAAEAIGSRFQRRPAGGFGDVAVFSFHGSKTLTTGEGGMLVTDNDDLWDRVMRLRDHGRRPGDINYYNYEVGFKYKMSALQAALGHAQLGRLDELVRMKRQIFEWYRTRLAGDDRLTLNPEPASTFNSFWMTTVVLDDRLGMRKEVVGERLAAVGVSTRPFFHPLSSLPAYGNSADQQRALEANVRSYRLGDYGLNMPSALCLSEDDVDYACSALLDALDAGPVLKAAF